MSETTKPSSPSSPGPEGRGVAPAADAGTLARFGLVGFINTIAGYALFIGLERLMPWWPAYAIAFFAGVVLSYWLNTGVVFRVQRSWSSALRFPLVYVVQFIVATIVMAALIEGMGVAPAIAALMTLAITVPITYLTMRWTLTGKAISR
jgi:putative flippase GtrA